MDEATLGEGKRGQLGTEKGGRRERAQDGCEQPTCHHLLPLAFRGKVRVVEAGGPAVGVRPCPAVNAGSKAVAWGSHGA